MKKLKLLLLMLLPFLAGAQNDLTLSANGVQPNKLFTCQESVFSMKIDRSSGFAASNQIILTFHLPAGMELVSVAGAPNAVMLNDDSVQVNGLTGSTFILNYTLKPKCGFFDANTISGVSHSVTASFDGTEQTSTSNTGYSIDAPYLIFRSDLSQKLNYTLGEYGQPYTRKYVWINTGVTPFTGTIIFKDTLRSIQQEASIRIQDARLVYPGLSLMQDVVSDTSSLLQFSVVNMAVGDSIVIEEDVVVTGCTLEDSWGDFSLRYGCAGEEACEQVEFAPATSGILDQSKKPELVRYSPAFMSGYNMLTPSYSGCLSDPQLRVLEIRNIGTGTASSARFTAFGVSWLEGIWNYYSKIDTLSIAVTKVLNGVEVPVTFHKLNPLNTTQGTAAGRNGYQQYFQEYETDSVLRPGEILYIRYNELVKCFDSTEYDDLFNKLKRISNTYMGVYLNHPCLATPEVYVDPLISVNYGGQQHHFSFTQSMYNLEHPSVVDEEEIWLEANDLSVFNPGYSNPAGFAFNPDSSGYVLRIDLEPGFELLNDSVYIYSMLSGEEWPWYPDQIEYFGNITTGNADGGYLLAHFSIPDTFYVDAQVMTDNFVRTRTRYYGNHSVATTYFTQFFSDFNVRFKLKSHCDKAIESVANVTESLFFVPNTYCDPNCQIPLSRVGTVVKFLCPGCILPGFNVTRFDLNRSNIGYADANDDHFPDALPFENTTPDLANVERKHVLIGDTIRMDLSAFTSDGRDYRFDNINFPLDEGQVFVTGTFLKNLKFIGASGTFNGQNITIPASAGLFSDLTFALPNTSVDVFSINIGAAELAAYGVSGFSQFNLYDSIRLHADFVVTKNLVNGSFGNPRYSPEELYSFVYMSGEPFTGYRVRTDANELLKPEPTDNYGVLTPAERADLDYWCTGGIAKILGVGVDLRIGVGDGQYNPNLTYAGFGMQNVVATYPAADPCYKAMFMENYVGIGEHAGNYYYPYQTQNLIDAFPNELRNLWKPTKAEVNFPGSFYEIDRVFVNFGFQVYNEGTNSHTYRRYMMAIPVTDPNITINDSTATIDLLHFYDQRTGLIPFQNPYVVPKDSILRYDEGLIGEVIWSLKMKDCDIPDTVYFGGSNYEEKLYFSDFIFSEGRDTVIKRNYTTGRYFDKPSAELIFDPFDEETVDGNWTAEFSTDQPFLSGGTSDYNNNSYINNFAKNSFVYFVSPSGNIDVTSVMKGNTVLPQVSTINGLPVYGVGDLGANGRTGTYTKANLSISSAFTCENVVDRDSVMVIFGWNCYGYPTSIEEACFKDTSWLYINLLEAGLQSELLGNNQIRPCGENEFRIKLHPTGYNSIENIQIETMLSAGLTYVAGSGYVQQGAQTEAIEPDGAAPNLLWDMDSISFLLNQFSSASQDAYLVFRVLGGCEAGGSSINAQVNATNYCNKPLTEINLSMHLNNAAGVANEIVSIDHSGMCNGNNTISVTINNGEQTGIDLTVYDAATNQAIGTLQATGLAPGTTAAYTITLSMPSTSFYIDWNACACVDRYDYAYSCVEPCTPDATFSVADVCKGLNVQPVPNATVGTHSWTFSYLNQSSSLVSPVFPATMAGTYTITHTVTLPCGGVATSTQQVEIFQPHYTSIVLIGNSPLCEGQTATLTVANAGNFTDFEWNTGETTSEITISGGGYYHVDVMDANGCVSHCSSITVSQEDRPDDAVDTLYICESTDRVTLDAGIGYGSYAWNMSGETTQTVTVTGPGTYVATICNTAATACCGTYTFVVMLDTIHFDVQDLAICPNATQTVNAPVSGAAYSWTHNGVVVSTQDHLDITTAGSYTLTVANARGCSYTDSFEVTQLALEVSTFSATDVCVSAGASCFTPDATGAGLTHYWIFTQNGVVTTSNDEVPCIDFTVAGNVSIEHQVTNTCGTSVTTLNIQVFDLVQDSVTTVYICSATDQVSLNAGTGFASYAWDFNGATTSTVTVTGTGTYTATLCNDVKNGCCGTHTFNVVMEVITFDLPDFEICPGASQTVNAPVMGNAYSWTHNGSVVSTTDQLDVKTAGTFTFTLTSVNGCEYTDSFVVNQLPDPISTFNTTDIVCSTAGVTCFTPDVDEAGYNHHWIFTQNGSSMHFFDAAPCVDFASAGTVTIMHIVTNPCGSDSSTATLNVVDAVDGGCIEIIGQNPMCPGSTVTLTTSGNYVSVEWHDANGNVIGYGPSITVSQAGVYSATATDANGCVSTCICTTLSEAKVSYQHLNDLVLCPGQTGRQYIKGNGLWSTGTYGDSETFTEAGQYYVDITSPEGCTYREDFTVSFANMDASIVIQLAKSPKNFCNYTFTASGVSNGAVSFDWYLDNSYVGSGQQVIYSHSGAGIIGAQVKLVIRDQYGCTYEFVSTYHFKPCMGIIDAGGFGPKMIVAPNPFETNLNVSYSLGEANRGELRLTDMRNQVVFTTELSTLSDQVNLDLTQISSGTYMLQLFGNGALIESQRVVKLK